MEDFEVQAEVEEKKERSFHLLPLQAEPNLWRVLEKGDETQKLWGLVMTYVDDIFICSSSTVLEALKKKVSGDLEDIQARRRVWRANSLSGNGSFKKN